MVSPLLIALELGLAPEASAWTSFGDVASCILSDLGKKIGFDSKAVQQPSPPKLTLTISPERLLHSLPPVLQSHRGITRVFLISPDFIVELLETLLKETARNNILGDACRRHFCFIVEGITPLIDVPNRHDLFASLTTSAQFTLDYVGGSGGLAIITSMLFSGIAAQSTLLPTLRRCLQEVVKHEESWTADVAAMLCLSYLETLSASVEKEEATSASQLAASSSAVFPSADAVNPWTFVGKQNRVTPRFSLVRPSDAPSISSSGDFLLISKDPSTIVNIPFPEKMPTSITVPSAAIISCAIMSSQTLTVKSALKLGQWCLQALHSLPLTITACALTHLMIKFPSAFRVSMAPGEKPMRFCDSVIVSSCRIVTTLFERRLQHGVYGHFHNADVETFPEYVAEQDESVHSVDVMPCFLTLCLQAIQCNAGLLLSDDSQRYLGKLFVHTSRLYVSHHSFIEEGHHVASNTPQRHITPQRQEPSEIVSKVFRATLRAVDLVLHDYEAGSPEVLRLALVQSAPPNAVLINRTQEYGSFLEHQDLMETIFAACDGQLEARLRSSQANPKESGRNANANNKVSLVGWLPCSADPPVLGGSPYAPDGGLTIRQKRWVVRRMLEYFKREWYLARIGVQTVQLSLRKSKNDPPPPSKESYLDLLPKPL